MSTPVPRDEWTFRLLGEGDPEAFRGRVYDGTDGWTCSPGRHRLRRRDWRTVRLRPLPPEHVAGCVCLKWLPCAWLRR